MYQNDGFGFREEGNVELVLFCEEPKPDIMSPFCQSTKVVKNGLRKNKKQVYKCQTYMKTYQDAYFYRGANPDIKALASKMLIRGSGTPHIAYVLSISRGSGSNLIASYASIYQSSTQAKTLRLGSGR